MPQSLKQIQQWMDACQQILDHMEVPSSAQAQVEQMRALLEQQRERLAGLTKETDFPANAGAMLEAGALAGTGASYGAAALAGTEAIGGTETATRGENLKGTDAGAGTDASITGKEAALEPLQDGLQELERLNEQLITMAEQRYSAATGDEIASFEAQSLNDQLHQEEAYHGKIDYKSSLKLRENLQKIKRELT